MDGLPIRRHEVVAAILAAGQGSRMGLPKALLRIDKTSALQRILGAYRTTQIRPVVVLAEPQRFLASTVSSFGSELVFNPHPEEGPLSSLQLALKRAPTSSAMILHPVDFPLVRAETLRSLLLEHRWDPATILIPTCWGQKGHPVLFPQRFYPDLLRAPLEKGARCVVRERQPFVKHVRVGDEGILANLNSPSDLAFWHISHP